MADERPNILLVVTDQQRGDCLGIDGHPVLQTPYLDACAAEGACFRRAYSAHPQCIPARRTLMTGRRAVNHGVFNNHNSILPFPTIAGELSKAGYQSHHVGKSHLWPNYALHGFMSGDFADDMRGGPEAKNDYARWLHRQGMDMPLPGEAHGCNQNGRVVRPWHLDERYHLTNWCVDRSLDFLSRRDPLKPFFLYVGFLQPHEPLVPPAFYFERYLRRRLPAPVFGDWCAPSRGTKPGLPVAPWFTEMTDDEMHEFRAAYYGCINHIDDQLGRLFNVLPRNTLVVFTSDHGEMLGDHRLIRKTRPFEGSARIPFVMNWPEAFGKARGLRRGMVTRRPVELMDVMPTLLDAAGAPIPEGVDGSSLLPLLRGEEDTFRDAVHGEMAVCGGAEDYGGCRTGMQFLTDGRWKYAWEPGPGREYLFDLDADPQELRNLAALPAHDAERRRWRSRLVAELKGRPEGFVANDDLVVLGDQTKPCLPGFETPSLEAIAHKSR